MVFAIFALSGANILCHAQQDGGEHPLDIKPDIAVGVTGKVEAAPKFVKMPAPPVPDRSAVKTGQPDILAAPQVTAAPLPQEPTSQEPVGESGLLPWFSSANQTVEGAANDAVLSSKSGEVATVDLSDPHKPKPLSSSDPRDDDLEDDEKSKLVEKQVPSVEIACLKPELMAFIHQSALHFGGTPVITSGFRNRGRRGSHHRKCEAADYFIAGVSSWQLVNYLKSLPGAGGVGTYCHTKSVHIDIGEPRNWHQCGFRRSFALRTPVAAQIGSR